MSGCVARVAASFTSVDSAIGPCAFCLGYGAVAGWVLPQINLIVGCREINATRSCVVNFVIPVVLGILVQDEVGH